MLFSVIDMFLLISNVITLCIENIFCKLQSIDLRLILWPSIWSVLLSVLCVLEQRMYFLQLLLIVFN